MTLIEAIKSGRPFKRELWDSSEFIIFKDNNPKWLNEDSRADFTKNDMLATDWQIQPERVEFEADWDEISYNDRPLFFPRLEKHFDLKTLKGKRTRVTVEVLP